MKQLLAAAWIAPMDQPVLADGAVVIENGRIVAVGSAGAMRRQHADAEVEELGDSVLMPGLVNAHTHLELSDACAGAAPDEGFVGWLKGIMARGRVEPGELPDKIASATAAGVGQCLRFGVSSVGDISKQCLLSRPVLAGCPLRVVSYGEVQAMAGRRGLLEERLTAAMDRSWQTARLGIGLTPHAPYSIERAGYEQCLEIARQQHMPLATHLAETPYEAEFLADHSGAFRELWDFIGGWDDRVLRFAGGPIRFAQAIGLLDYPTLLAHVNYCDDAELDLLARSRASVVYCPRTHAYFGHPPHRWREMMRRGINVALGSDSCASSPDLNVVDDLRVVHGLAPDLPVEQLWRLVTVHGARAIGLADQVGSLTPGNIADLVAFAARGDEPLSEILRAGLMPQRLWIGGKALAW